MNNFDSSAKLGTTRPVSQEILEKTKELSEKAMAINDRVHGKLSPVMISPRPVSPGPEGKQPREYPPLFSELREMLINIENALDGIEDVLSRTEL